MYTKSDWFEQWGLVEGDGALGVKCPADEIIDKSLSNGAFVLLLYIRFIASHGDFKDYSKNRLAEDLGLTTRSINNKLYELKSTKYLDQFQGTWLTNDKDGKVYFIQAIDGGPIKIGKALDIKRRLKSLQTDHYSELRVIASIPDGGVALEKTLHDRFKEYRIRGEWFEPADELIKYINILNQTNDS